MFMTITIYNTFVNTGRKKYFKNLRSLDNIKQIEWLMKKIV